MTTHVLSPAQFQDLRRLDTCQVSNAIERFNTRLRNEGYSDSTVRCLFPRLGSTLGYAATLKVRCSDPPTEGDRYLERTTWWDHLLSIPAPRILAIQDVDPRAGSGAFLGEVHASIAQALSCVGAITNGAVRDLPRVEAMGFQLFAGAISVSHAYIHVVEIGGVLEIAGLKVAPGDLLHGDQHGVISIPPELAAQIPAAAARIAEEEQQIVQLCRGKGFSVEQMRTLVRELRSR